MNKAALVIAFLVFDALIVAGMTLWLMGRAGRPPLPPVVGTWVHQHHLIVHDRPESVLGHISAGVTALDATDWLVLEPFDGPVVYESALIGRIEFNEALLSWNIRVPDGCGVRIDLLVAHGGRESPYMYVGRCGDVVDWETPPQEFAWSDEPVATGKIDVDYFVSDQAFDGLRYRITAVANDDWSGEPVRVRRISACLTQVGEEAATSMITGATSMDVPFRSQRIADASLAGRICSPTSLTMVLAYHGVDLPVETVARRVFDAEFDIYGNWPRNVQAAYELGVEGYVTRFESFADLADTLDRGMPVIVSVQVNEGELPAAPYKSTDGHLIVVRGFDSSGNVLVNDPAVGPGGRGSRVYSRQGMRTVWLDRVKGTAYVLLRRPAGAAGD